MKKHTLIPNLFRTEFSKIVTVLSKTFGIENIQIAEDIASDTFLVASETWSLKGIPENPKAWLYSVAKNKTKDYLKRNSLFVTKITPELTHSHQSDKNIEIDLSDKNIEDSQLKMLFTICNPSLSKEAQISLALRILCGLGIEEIAAALLTSKSTINKRLLRAKANFKKHNITLALPENDELAKRQSSVLTIIYLLFNEGYYSHTTEHNTRKHLCLEAMGLLYLFINYQSTSEANALMALFCFHASRFDAREDDQGNALLYEDQDSKKWNLELILKGEEYFKQSTIEKTLSKYHLEASIAMCHMKIRDESKWESILQLYNRLLQIEYSPVAALNRTYALSKIEGKEKAIKEALKISLDGSHLYHALLADLYCGIHGSKEIHHLKTAIFIAKSKNEKHSLQLKLEKALRQNNNT